MTAKSPKAFHSFRHTVNAHLQAKGVPQEVREALLGHTSRSTNVAVYGDKLPLGMLKETVEKLEYNLEITPVMLNAEQERSRQKARRSVTRRAHRQNDRTP